MSVSVVIPTVKGREEYLKRCVRAYMERTTPVPEIIVIRDRPSCGVAWQEGAEQATGDYLHLTADDILPDPGWFDAMRAVSDAGAVPVGLVRIPTAETMDENEWPVDGRPFAYEAFFERQPSGRADVPEGYVAQGDSEYPSIPFCSRQQWHQIGPMIASHYGTDKWFGWRAKQAGFPNVVTHGARFWHYVAGAGRHPGGGWTNSDRLDFDLLIAWPEYLAGRLAPWEPHPLYGTDEGLAQARARAHR